MDRMLLVIVIVALMAGGWVAGGAWLAQQANSEPYAPTYQTLDGPCQIRVYNDPLWAEHYAKNVNTPNCDAYLVQEQAEQTEAVTHKIDWETEQAKIAVFSIFGVVAAILGLLAVAIWKG